MLEAIYGFGCVGTTIASMLDVKLGNRQTCMGSDCRVVGAKGLEPLTFCL